MRVGGIKRCATEPLILPNKACMLTGGVKVSKWSRVVVEHAAMATSREAT